MRWPSAFSATGVVLSLLSLVGIWWIGLKAGLTLRDVVRLGHTGITATSIGGAALAARKPPIAAGRAVFGMAAYVASVLGATAVYDYRADPFRRGSDLTGIGDPDYADTFAPVPETTVTIDIDWHTAIEHIATVAGITLVAAAIAVIAIRGPRAGRGMLLALATLPVVYETATLWADGAEVGSALGVAATVWLVLAFRRAAAIARTRPAP